MLPRHAEDLRFHLERSPFSEDVTVVDDSQTLVVDKGGARTVDFECAFNNGGAGDIVFEYSLVPVEGVSGVVLRGIFDESVERDEGNKALRRKPRVIVFAWPRAAKAGTRVLVRGKEYAVASCEADANLGMAVWLR